MDELLKEMERFKDLTSAFTLVDVAFVMALSFALSVAIALVYRETHRGTSYSQSYAQTLVILGMIVALIMLIIGSNLARAFSLVGALSIIRFRNAVKETRDVGFVFLVMAIGMACGTRFYILATFATAMFSAVLLGMHRLNTFQKDVREQVLKIRMPVDVQYEEALGPVLHQYLEDFRLISVETTGRGALVELSYSVVAKASTDLNRLLDAICTVNGNNRVFMAAGQEHVDL